jgi:hypothetical protein
MSQPDGSYPRVTASMLQTGHYNGMLVSVVGKLCSGGGRGGAVPMETCDGSQVMVTTDHFEGDSFHVGDPAMVLEIVGQVVDEQTFTVRT